MTKRRFFGVVLLLGTFSLLLAACGEKSQEDVVEKLQETVADLDGYKATANMTMNTSDEEQNFLIDVWFQAEEQYRVKLENESEQNESQIILKNTDGVFVLTPALEKSFKFQSEWPENSSQPYLFQSLVNDVIQDPESQFETTEDHYIFRTKTNYQNNNNLPAQEIYFDKSSYTPVMVNVLNQDGETLVSVAFQSFELDATFKEDDFSMEKNMKQEADGEAANLEEEGETAEAAAQEIRTLYPTFTAGAEIAEKKEVPLEDGERIITTFEGEKNFTLVQKIKETAPVSTAPQEVDGDIVNLGVTVGALEGNALKWSYQGVDYQLASTELTKEEMIEIAQSVQGQSIK
ncbi:outer membrane lipoprotein carrier protein LolA [Oceanobacillus sp. J11TS1]|uniref:LolA family protein n=1 Tax=Oceanobacillus sp. J11TS1 TaxID=2807191 RepID=UPI001B25E9B8|nr:outer membrane lipoprotein carrier protein LolA [Oceanobacillus sp. J11TS1]GIO24321.1 sporulation protein YdcC [Oceanobacillus sp. J11TS1]